MSVNKNLAMLVGNWTCTNRLNFGQGAPIHESPCTASVSLRVGGQCVEIAYGWEFEGRPQEGVILLSGNSKSDEMTAVWTDSFHSSNTLMFCSGNCNEAGNVSVSGSYSAPGSPDWHWRTEIIPGDDSFKYLMTNIAPDGQEEWAVEMDFVRR